MTLGMRYITQTQLYEGPERRGNCVQACYATLFGLPIDRAPTLDRVSDWLALNYPTVALGKVDLREPTEEPPAPMAGERLFWIASVHTTTEGFTDPCGRCWMYEGNENGPPIYPAQLCPWCGTKWGLAKGTRPGYHAVVMLGRDLDWDPHPNADYERQLVFTGYEHFYVRNLAALTPRPLPVVV